MKLTDVRNAVNAGKVVTIHANEIMFNGWTGAGYTILDKISGAGAYMIGGGLDGGFTNWIKDNATDIGVALTFISILSLGLASVGAAVAITGAVSLLAGVLSIVLAAYVFRLSYLEAISTAISAKSRECINNIFLLLASINLALGLIALFAAPAAAVILAFPILIYGDSLATAVSRACNDLSSNNENGF